MSEYSQDVMAKHRMHVHNPADWPSQLSALAPDILISCLGTTMAQAGSKDAFRAVDHDLVLAVAQAAKATGTRHMIAISSVGASAQASNFYLRTKGEIESGLRTLGFDRLDIIRPGLLTGGKRKDHRPGEALASVLSPVTDRLLWGPLSRYRSTPVALIARAIIALIHQSCTDAQAQFFIHQNDSIKALAS
jgi:uncharacterized protein YbjT (DUF2867 family)